MPAPTPPDPHVKKKTPLPAVLIVAVLIIVGLCVVFANRPGAGMGGSVTGTEQSTR